MCISHPTTSAAHPTHFSPENTVVAQPKHNVQQAESINSSEALSLPNKNNALLDSVADQYLQLAKIRACIATALAKSGHKASGPATPNDSTHLGNLVQQTQCRPFDTTFQISSEKFSEDVRAYADDLEKEVTLDENSINTSIPGNCN